MSWIEVDDETGVTEYRPSLVNGTAFLWTVGLDLSPYATTYNRYRAILTDSGGKTATGYIDTVGTGETTGSELLSNPLFEDRTLGTEIGDNNDLSGTGGTQNGTGTPAGDQEVADGWNIYIAGGVTCTFGKDGSDHQEIASADGSSNLQDCEGDLQAGHYYQASITITSVVGTPSWNISTAASGNRQFIPANEIDSGDGTYTAYFIADGTYTGTHGFNISFADGESGVVEAATLKEVTLDNWTIYGTRSATNYLEYQSDNQLAIVSDGNNMGVSQAVTVANTLYKNVIDFSATASGQLKIKTTSDHIVSLIADNTSYFVADGTTFYIQNDDSAACNITLDGNSLKQVTECPTTAVHIVSNLNSTTRNWASIDSGFNAGGISSLSIQMRTATGGLSSRTRHPAINISDVIEG